MNIKRVNCYDDSRFSKHVLAQHGCFLIDDEPYEADMFNNHYVFACGHPVFAENIGNELVITFGFNKQDKKIVLSNVPLITSFKFVPISFFLI